MKTVLNYCWLQSDTSAPSAIPEPSFAMLQRNAERYPDAQFNLWVESSEAFEPYGLPPNVVVHNLNSIPSFAQNSDLQSKDENLKWWRFDTTRLLIMQHTLGNPNVSKSIYSDFDVENVLLDSPDLNERLKRYGAAFGGTYNLDAQGNKVLVTDYENGYMAFGQIGKKLLDHIISFVPTPTAEQIADKVYDRKTRNGVFNKVMTAVDVWASDSQNSFSTDWRSKVASFLVLPPCLFKIDPALKAAPENFRTMEYVAIEKQKNYPTPLTENVPARPNDLPLNSKVPTSAATKA